MAEPNAVSSELFDTVPVVDFDVHFLDGQAGQFTLFEGDKVEPANLTAAHPTITVTLQNKRTNSVPEEITIYVENVKFTSVRRTTRWYYKSGIIMTTPGQGKTLGSPVRQEPTRPHQELERPQNPRSEPS